MSTGVSATFRHTPSCETTLGVEGCLVRTVRIPHDQGHSGPEERSAKTRSKTFDRDNIINEQELLGASDQLVASLAQHAQATPRGGRPHPTRTAAPPRATRHRVVGRAGGAVGRDPLTATPTAGPRRAIPPPQPHTRHTAAQSRPHRHGGRQWPEPVALAGDGGRRRAERRSPPTVPEFRLGFDTSGRSRPHVCAGPADDANRQDPHLPMRERVGTPAA